MGPEPGSYCATRSRGGSFQVTRGKSGCSHCCGCKTHFPETLGCSRLLDSGSETAPSGTQGLEGGRFFRGGRLWRKLPLVLVFLSPARVPHSAPEWPLPTNHGHPSPSKLCFQETGPMSLPQPRGVTCLSSVSTSPHNCRRKPAHLSTPLYAASQALRVQISAWPTPRWRAECWPLEVCPCPNTQNPRTWPYLDKGPVQVWLGISQ